MVGEGPGTRPWRPEPGVPLAARLTPPADCDVLEAISYLAGEPFAVVSALEHALTRGERPAW